jgi:hypothetical protein
MVTLPSPKSKSLLRTAHDALGRRLVAADHRGAEFDVGEQARDVLEA